MQCGCAHIKLNWLKGSHLLSVNYSNFLLIRFYYGHCWKNGIYLAKLVFYIFLGINLERQRKTICLTFDIDWLIQLCLRWVARPLCSWVYVLLCIPVPITVVISPLQVARYLLQDIHGWKLFHAEFSRKVSACCDKQQESQKLCVRRFAPFLRIVCRACILCIHLYFVSVFSVGSVL